VVTMLPDSSAVREAMLGWEGGIAGFALGLLAKDVGIAADLAEAVGVNAPACHLVRDRWAEAAAGLGFAADHSEAHKQWWTIDLAAGASDDGASDPGAPG
jgi:hypothetical protein